MVYGYVPVPDITVLGALLGFGVLVYVVLSYAVDRFAAHVALRRASTRRRVVPSYAAVTRSAATRQGYPKPPSRAITPCVGEGRGSPGRVVGVGCVSRVFVSQSKGRGGGR
ncbi:MAG: hypothetical protein ACTJLK_02195 [Anaplasma sp.]